MIVKDRRLLVRIISAVAQTTVLIALVHALVSSHSVNLCKSFQAPAGTRHARMAAWMMDEDDDHTR
jgi:hypothetical protein